MSIVEGRGGYPHVFRAAIATTGRDHQFPFTSKFLKIRAADYTCKVYFSEVDYTNDENYIVVPVAAAETPHGEWEGPVEISKVWLKGVTGTSNIELVAFQRRG
jgi:hypothetical protein